MVDQSASGAWPLVLVAVTCGWTAPALAQVARRPPRQPAAAAPDFDPSVPQLRLRVVGVHDGDTLTGLDETKTKVKVRLHGIDAPEIGQAHGQAAKQVLSGKVFGKDVVVVPTDTDKYGRTIGRVFIDGRDVNLELLAEGMAWHYSRYDQTMSFARAEQAARTARKGLWADRDPEAPWDHRASERDSKRAAAAAR